MSVDQSTTGVSPSVPDFSNSQGDEVTQPWTLSLHEIIAIRRRVDDADEVLPLTNAHMQSTTYLSQQKNVHRQP